MKLLITFIAVFLLGAPKLFAAPIDNTDSLKKQLSLASDSLKAPIYTRLAACYLGYDAITDDSAKKAGWQNHALDFTLKALHYYSRYNDTTGLLVSFNILAMVYRDQKKYSQAKWFILQSNTLSRAKKDAPNIIASLIELASIKEDIKDYDLAIGDLTEALKISSDNRLPGKESAVQLSFAQLYGDMKDYPKAAMALKRHKAIDESIRLQQEVNMIAKINSWDSIQIKKKTFVTKPSKPAATKSIVSL